MVKIAGMNGTIRDDESGQPLVNNQSQTTSTSTSTSSTNEPFTLRGESQLFGFKVPNWSMILALILAFLLLGMKGLGR